MMAICDESGAARIRRSVADHLLGKPIIVNFMRGTVVEAIVADVLEPSWKWDSDDWAGWDFIHPSGRKLEVKQSAAHQTWRKDTHKPSKPVFDIGKRKGSLAGADWTPGEQRYADIYIFAHHPLIGDEVDHCDPEQWWFYVVPTVALPDQDNIALSVIAKLVSPCRIDALKAAVDHALAGLA